MQRQVPNKTWPTTTGRRHHELDAFAASGTSPPHGPNVANDVGTSLEPMLTTRGLAELLNQTPAWVLRMVHEQALPGFRFGGALRYYASEVRIWIEQHRIGPHPTTRLTEDPDQTAPLDLLDGAQYSVPSAA